MPYRELAVVVEKKPELGYCRLCCRQAEMDCHLWEHACSWCGLPLCTPARHQSWWQCIVSWFDWLAAVVMG